jgi:hypothetical protein
LSLSSATSSRDLGRRIHAGRWLVEEDQLGPADEGQGEGKALAFAARQDPIADTGHPSKTDPLEQVVGVERVAIEPGVQPDELGRASLRVDPAVLEHQADPSAQRRALSGGIEPEHSHLPAIGGPVPLEDLDRRRLARAIGTDQRRDRARCDLEVEPVDHRPAAIALAQLADEDRRRGGRGHFRIAASWRSKSGWETWPIWRDAITPSRPMK